MNVKDWALKFRRVSISITNHMYDCACQAIVFHAYKNFNKAETFSEYIRRLIEEDYKKVREQVLKNKDADDKGC